MCARIILRFGKAVATRSIWRGWAKSRSAKRTGEVPWWKSIGSPSSSRPLEDRERFRTERIEVLIVGSQLDAAQTKVLRAALDLFERVWLEWMHGQEANELFRVRLHECGGVVVDAWGLVDELAVVGQIAAWIGRDIEDDRAVDYLHGAHMIVPGVGGRGRLIGTPFAVERGAGLLRSHAVPRRVAMDIDDHGSVRTPRFTTARSIRGWRQHFAPPETAATAYPTTPAARYVRTRLQTNGVSAMADTPFAFASVL